MSERREKFTPGPWFASGQLIFAESQKHPIPIAAVNGLWLLTGNTFEDNAALIAAAPEMYALLSNILNDLETDGNISLNDNAANDIRMLLAKARGEAETCKG